MPVLEHLLESRATTGASGERASMAASSLPHPSPGLLPIAQIERHLELVQREVDGLRCELDLMRRRDDALSYHLRRLDDELRLAARLQRDFLPKSFPQLGGVRLDVLYRPAGYVSGDLYDVVRLDERRLGFYVADAVGHGMPPALLTMFLKNALVTKEVTADGYRLLDPAEGMGRLNRALIGQNLSHATFATAVYGTIDTTTNEVRLAKAGHPAPLLLRADGGVEWVEPSGSLLGIFPDEPFEVSTFRLAAGDRLFVYTDGVEVAFGNDAQADATRWRKELVRSRHLPAGELLGEFARLIDAEGGGVEPRDDLTVLTMEVG